VHTLPNPPHIGWSRAPEPLSELLPQTRAELLRAIATLEAWGVVVPPDSRLRVAADRLDAAKLLGQASVPTEAIRELCASVITAVDFRDIAAALPAERVRTVRTDLTTSVTGGLFGPETRRVQMQLESQHLVAAALRLAGLEPHHPTLSGKKGKSGPDIFVELGAVHHGIEVKRPESPKSVVARFEDARDQIVATKQVGAIVIDATDILKQLRHGELLRAVQDLSGELDEIVCPAPRVGYRPGFESIVCTLVFARGAWVRQDVTPGLLSVEHSAASSAFGFEDTILIGEWLQAAFAAGFERTGFS
jgi:hypothetical protein